MNNIEADPSGVDWQQIGELLDCSGDAEQRTLVCQLWLELHEALAGGWARVDAAVDDAGIRTELHRMRGFAGTWGLARFTHELRIIENGAAPVVEWSRRRDELHTLMKRSVAAIQVRYPFLGE